jgi:hypothetical protein
MLGQGVHVPRRRHRTVDLGTVAVREALAGIKLRPAVGKLDNPALIVWLLDVLTAGSA